MLERIFQMRARGTNTRTELEAGLTTFLTMAYIIFVNPLVLSNIPALKDQIPALVAATCLAAAVPCLLMGLWTNSPFGLAPGMGLNGVLAFGIVLTHGATWQTAMGVVVLEGIIIAILVLTRLREAVMDSIPVALKQAISVGIGLFITMLGLVNAGMVKMSGNPGSPLTFGSFREPTVMVATAGLAITMVFFLWRWKSALLAGIGLTTLISLVAGVSPVPDRLVQMPDFRLFGQADVASAFTVAMFPFVLAFLMSDFFDTMGTVIGVGQQAGLVDERGRIPRMRDVLLVDSLAAIWGGLCGASSSTTYVESASGVAEGGRTGLTTVTVGLLFLFALFFSPIVGVVPAQATAPALIIVGFLMLRQVRDIPFDNVAEALPAFLTLITIPLTYSISRGIGVGFLSYLLLLVAQRRYREINPFLLLVSALFLLAFALE